jgi:WD40 repeat protein
MAKGFRRLFANYGKDRNGYKARQGMVGRTSCSHRLDIPSIPSSVWIEYIFPFLDRHCQNQLCAASRDVYEGIKILGVEQPWPQGKFRVGIVLAVAFSPRGEELAFVTANSRSVTIWNRQRGFEQTLNGHRGQCSNVAYAPSNEYLVSCSRNDGSVRLWRKEQRDNDEICQKYVNYRTLKIQVFATLFVRVSSDSKDIASFGGDGKIYVSNADDGSLRASTYWRSRLFIDCCDCVAFSSRRYAILAHTFNNQTVRLWNYQNRTSVELEDYDNTRIADYAAYITSIKFVETTIFDGSTEDSNQEYLIVVRETLSWLSVSIEVKVSHFPPVYVVYLGL